MKQVAISFYKEKTKKVRNKKNKMIITLIKEGEKMKIFCFKAPKFLSVLLRPFVKKQNNEKD